MTQDPTADEMRQFLIEQYGNDAKPDTDSELNFDVEESIYWFASDWHGGQWSNLYSALSTSEYHPGRSTNGPESGALSAMMYDSLEQEYASS